MPPEIIRVPWLCALQMFSLITQQDTQSRKERWRFPLMQWCIMVLYNTNLYLTLKLQTVLEKNEEMLHSSDSWCSLPYLPIINRTGLQSQSTVASFSQELLKSQPAPWRWRTLQSDWGVGTKSPCWTCWSPSYTEGLQNRRSQQTRQGARRGPLKILQCSGPMCPRNATTSSNRSVVLGVFGARRQEPLFSF